MYKKWFIVCIICLFFILTHLTKQSQPSGNASLIRGPTTMKCIGDIDRVDVNPKLMQVIKDTFRVLSYTKASVYAGTMLHFYRECTLLSDTNDIDFVIPFYDITYEMVERFKSSGYKVIQSFGEKGQPGFEMAFHHPNGVKVDIFGEVETPYYNWTPLWVNNKLRKCRYPSSELITLKIAMGETVTIKSPPEQILSHLYGLQWREPVPTKTWGWINPYCTI